MPRCLYYMPHAGDLGMEGTKPLPSRAPSIFGVVDKEGGTYKTACHCTDGDARGLLGSQEDFLEKLNGEMARRGPEKQDKEGGGCFR